jgi:hypothetical protein
LADGEAPPPAGASMPPPPPPLGKSRKATTRTRTAVWVTR